MFSINNSHKIDIFIIVSFDFKSRVIFKLSFNLSVIDFIYFHICIDIIFIYFYNLMSHNAQPTTILFLLCKIKSRTQIRPLKIICIPRASVHITKRWSMAFFLDNIYVHRRDMSNIQLMEAPVNNMQFYKFIYCLDLNTKKVNMK